MAFQLHFDTVTRDRTEVFYAAFSCYSAEGIWRVDGKAAAGRLGGFAAAVKLAGLVVWDFFPVNDLPCDIVFGQRKVFLMSGLRMARYLMGSI